MKNITVSANNIHIEESYDVSKKEFNLYIDTAMLINPSNLVTKNRSRFSLKMEWATHNFLYKIGLFKSHTADVDLNYPQKWYITALYCIAGMFSWIFIK